VAAWLENRVGRVLRPSEISVLTVRISKRTGREDVKPYVLASRIAKRKDRSAVHPACRSFTYLHGAGCGWWHSLQCDIARLQLEAIAHMARLDMPLSNAGIESNRPILVLRAIQSM